jgi:hypothetical protein
MKNVDIQAKKGMTIAYATLDVTNLKVTARDGDSIIVAPNANVTTK